MDEGFHPSSLSEILDRTAHVYRGRFLVFLGIAAIPTAVLLVPFGGLFLFLLWFGTRGNPTPAAGLTAGLAIAALGLIAVPIFVGASSLAMAGMNHAASRTIFAQATTIRDAYRAVWRRGWRYVGLYLMQLVAVWVLPIGAWTLLVMLAAFLTALVGNSGGALITLATLLVIVGLFGYGIWMSIRLSLAFPATVVEQSGAWEAMRRSWALTSDTKGRILLLYLLGTALNWILSFAISIPILIVISLLPNISSPQHAQTAGTVTIFVFYGLGFAIQVFTRPVYGIALMLFYYDQRIRREAFDIEWMMLKAGLVAPQAAQGAPVEAVAEAKPWMDGVAGAAAESAELPVVDEETLPATVGDMQEPSFHQDDAGVVEQVQEPVAAGASVPEDSEEKPSQGEAL